MFFDSVVRSFGLPKVVIHDRDPRFTSNFWRSLWALMGVRVALSSAHHPQTDGQTERAHRTLEQTLRCVLANRRMAETEWVDVLGVVELAMNSTVAAATGEVPMKLDLGEVPRLPADIVVDRDVAIAQPAAETMSKKIGEIVEATRERL